METTSIAECREICRKNPLCRSFETKPKCLPCGEHYCYLSSANFPEYEIYPNYAGWDLYILNPIPYTCAKIKKCSFIRTDTEINISPRTLNGQNVSVFCEGMSTDFPKEYITLRKPTYFEVPLISNTTSCLSFGENGRRRYNKVRFLPEEMVLDLNDKKFTTYEPFPHGKKMCLSKQNFTIDLRHTEFIISEKANWVTSGVSANITSSQISKDKQVAVISCSGKCGICKSISPFPVILLFNF
ncbi:ADAMTS9 [Acanthosepion pharaonis]|uniref:ADAMTS9 n=1 Tax=Acanthosepion pharaonis TaxID=158019 RepID=A0A812CTF2_ACAPH|nr:ADAMTS9 [Sepia pharaonis]